MIERLPRYDTKGRRIVRVPEVIFFDVDRCAVDTAKAFAIAVEATAYNTPMTAVQLHDEYQRAKAAGESYNVVGFIDHSLENTGYSWHTHVEADFVARGRQHDLLMKDAHKVLEYAAAEEVLLSMFTYGASSPERRDQQWADAKTWQLAKAAAAGLDSLPIYVCNRRDKGSKIAKWYEQGDGFYLPDSMSVEEGVQTVARRAILIDDKTDSFNGMSAHIVGIRVTPEDEANQQDFQRGTLPRGVVAVYGMTEALGALKAIRAR